MLVEYLKERKPGSKTIVWCCWIPTCKTTMARLALEGIKCVPYYGKMSDVAMNDSLQAFNNDPEVTVCVGNPTKGGVGVPLHGRGYEGETRISQCDSIVYLAQGWSSAVRRQSEARPRDKYCDWSVEVVDILAEDSIDLDILERVMDKIAHANDVQDIRGILKKLVGGIGV